MTFGERLTSLRKENGYNSREKLAKELNIPSTTLRNYETNVREPGHKFLRDISNFFNVSVDYLLCITDKKEINNSTFFSPEEIKIIKKYKKLDSFGKKAVNNIVNIEYERCCNPIVIDVDGLKESLAITDKITKELLGKKKSTAKK